jgi:hypothetical protein
MGPRATVFLAEVRAISTIATVLMQRKHQKIVIRCDSQAAINAIISTNISSKTVAEADACLTSWGLITKFQSAGLKHTQRMRAMNWLIAWQKWVRIKRLDPLVLNIMKRPLLSHNLL